MGQDLLGDVVAEEVRLRERIVGVDEEAVLIAPYASQLPFQLMLAPRRPRARFEDDGPSGAALLHDGLEPAGAPSRIEPAAEPVRAHRAARRGALLLADRRAPAVDPPGGLELSTGVNLNIVAPEHAARVAARARRRTQALPQAADASRGTLRPPLCRRASAGGAAVRALGGAVERRSSSRPAWRSTSSSEELGEPGDDQLVPRPQLERADVRAGDIDHGERVRAVRLRELRPRGEDGDPSDFSAQVDFTEETAEHNPDWKLDLCDEVIGAWRGHGGAVAAMTLVWGRR